MPVKQIWVLSLLILIVAGLLATGWYFFDQLACEGQPINFRLEPTQEQQIWGEQVVSQSFIAPRDNLNRIDLLLETYQRQNTAEVSLSLLELSSNEAISLQGPKIVDLRFNAAAVKDRVWQTFTFPPIAGSAGKQYLIVLQSAESTPGNAITVGGIEWDTYAPGSAFLGTTPLRADISFRTCYQTSPGEKLQIFAQQITGHRPALWGSFTFYGFLLLIYLLLLAGLFWQLARIAL